MTDKAASLVLRGANDDAIALDIYVYPPRHPCHDNHGPSVTFVPVPQTGVAP